MIAASYAKSQPLIQLEQFGEEREPVVVIDNFSDRVAELERAGRAATYRPVQGFPGMRSRADRMYLAPMARMMGDIFSRIFQFRRADISSCDYSIVSLLPDELSPEQRIPHFDDPGPNLIALLHYIDRAESGGTAFYRHRRTGFESMRPERFADYEKGLAEDDREFGPVPPGYTYGDTDRFTMIGQIEAKPDRAIIYRGRTLHSGRIPRDPPRRRQIEKGRLTINTFLVGQT